jgi:hypothetical protein
MKTILILSAAALGIALSGAAHGQASEPGTSFLGPGGNVVGGGDWRLLGGGDDMTVVPLDRGAGEGPVLHPSLAGRQARIEGNHGDGPQVTYIDPAPQALGRRAIMHGGGDDREIRY